ncbi:DedA family protein [Alicyclobacillus sp.]|uniref:DedA family protein n=1 Tax=Alicyclobacillus sp. TaxID=61169 RepID=UPI0025BFBA93|nr:DedA family protein [Alicyclobacillus sp.]MCL6517497.1 DedA family protein [Alicyclobacillus sp.]
MWQWFGGLAEVVMDWGYAGVYAAMVIEGLGLPFPGDAVLALYGFLAAEGRMQPGGQWLAALAGYMTAAVIAYWVSRRFGTGFVHGLGGRLAMLNERGMMRTTRLIDRWGPWMLVPGRFLPGVRSMSSYVAGLCRMDWRPFLVYTGIGAGLWCGAWLGAGYWFGDHVDDLLAQSRTVFGWAAAVAVAGMAGLWLYRRRMARR